MILVLSYINVTCANHGARTAHTSGEIEFTPQLSPFLFCVIPVAQSLVVCVVTIVCPFVLFLLVILLSVL
jgi:hypothetical protein